MANKERIMAKLRKGGDQQKESTEKITGDLTVIEKETQTAIVPLIEIMTGKLLLPHLFAC